MPEKSGGDGLSSNDRPNRGRNWRGRRGRGSNRGSYRRPVNQDGNGHESYRRSEYRYDSPDQVTEHNSHNEPPQENSRWRAENGRPKRRRPKREVTPIRDYEDQAASLRSQIESNTSECMVCYENINAFCATYSCFQCHNIFHLACTRQWATAKLSDDSSALRDDTPRSWTCPACQVPSTKVPLRYTCFCGAIINPSYTPFVLPHSCGEKCSRPRSSCSHSCRELCHPGKCPECRIMVTTRCLCGAQSSSAKCSQRNATFQCERVCGRTLNCGKHTCTVVCHGPGECARCTVENELPCYCGKAVTNLVCGTEKASEMPTHIGYWCCGTPCTKALPCGNHTCSLTCHSGPCPPCPTDVHATTTCPCGKTRLEKLQSSPRQSCLDPVPTCRKVCRRELKCGSGDSHVCQAICHTGPCPDCADKSLVSCRCETTTQSLPCSEIPPEGVLCGRVCYKKKSCGRHRCTIECCLEDAHVCMFPCGKTLSCQLHKCEDLCHRGHCAPCLNSNFSEVFCPCGSARLDPPVACGTAPPSCDLPCSREHPCGHPVDHTCHYDESCPPCVELVNRLCMGGHRVRYNIPCHLSDISCGEPCRRPLPCNMHQCERPCHKEQCVSEGEEGKCEQPCTVVREKCSHRCAAKCHPGTDCPKSVCFERVTVSCPCQRRQVPVLCFAGATFAPSDSNKFLAKLRSSGITLSQGDLSEYMKGGGVPCEEACLIEERNRKLAEGLGLANVAIDNVVAPNYSDFLKDQVKCNKAFVVEVEEAFEREIGKYKRRNENADYLNKVNYTYHDFKPMARERRRVIHELAEHYRITSQSLDPEPQRNVQIRIEYHSAVPGVKLSQYLLIKRSFVGSSKPVPKPVSRGPGGTADMPELQSLVLERSEQKEVADSWEEMCEEG